MTKKTRTILFIICLFLFLVAAPSAVLYSLGYRFSFETKKIIQTGGLFFKVVPPGAKVFINNRLKGKTSSFFGSLLIEDLKPETYNIRIEKEGFYPWQKSLKVEKNKVTEAKNIVLIPKNPELKLIEKNIKNFWLSPDSKKIILQVEIQNKNKKSWILNLYDKKEKTNKFLLSEKELIKISNISQKNLDLLSLKWSADREKILIKTKSSKEKISYFIVELSNPPILNYLDFLGENVKKVSFNPRDSEIIFFMASVKQPGKENKNILFQSNYSQKEKPKLILVPSYLTEENQLFYQNLITYKISGKNIVWLTSNGFLYKSEIESGKILEVLNLKPFPIKKELTYEIITSGTNKTFLKENNTLYFLDPFSREFKKIASSIHSLSFAPDLKKAFYYTDSEIWLFFLKDTYEQPQKKIGEKVLLGRWTKKINHCFWLTSHYLIFTSGNKIKITEIDDRDKINIVNLKEFSSPSRIFWDPKDKILYILTNKNLFTIDQLIP